MKSEDSEKGAEKCKEIMAKNPLNHNYTQIHLRQTAYNQRWKENFESNQREKSILGVSRGWFQTSPHVHTVPESRRSLTSITQNGKNNAQSAHGFPTSVLHWLTPWVWNPHTGKAKCIETEQNKWFPLTSHQKRWKTENSGTPPLMCGMTETINVEFCIQWK